MIITADYLDPSEKQSTWLEMEGRLPPLVSDVDLSDVGGGGGWGVSAALRPTAMKPCD